MTNDLARPEDFSLTESARKRLRTFMEQARSGGLLEMIGADVIPLLAHHRIVQIGDRISGDTPMSYGDGVGIDRLSKLEQSAEKDVLILRHCDPMMAVRPANEHSTRGRYEIDHDGVEFRIVRLPE